MNRTVSLLIALLLAPLAALFGADAPNAESPAAGAIVYVPHPHFRWQREADSTLDDTYSIQIAKDAEFRAIVCDDTLAVVSRFVPVNPLAPAKYWWRVRRGEGAWSKATAFECREQERVFTIRTGSNSAEVARVINEAAAHSPSKVNFEPGEYRLDAGKGKSVATLREARDVIVDGHGARLVLSGTFLDVLNSERVTIQDFNVTGDKPGHTLVRVLKVDAQQRTLLVKPEPGYDADVPRFFGGQGFLNRVAPEHRGRHLGGFVSTQTAKATPAPDVAGAFIIGPVSDSALRSHAVDGLATITSYGFPFVNARHTDELTFSRITLVDTPGAFCGGSETSAKSYLACRVETRSPNDFQGGHSAVGDGRIGEWIEGCEFQMLADDGPNVRTMRMKIAKAGGVDAVVLEDSWTNTDLRQGDTVALVNSKSFATATAHVVNVSASRRPMQVQIDVDLQNVAKNIGVTDWSGSFFYRIDPCCEDFVYRHNRHMGGRGHGVKFNGKRGWIADNHFENITGNAIEIGYNWQEAFEGFGASDVLVAGNTIRRCGWAPISSHSKTTLGGRFMILNNHIHEVRDAAISLRACTNVIVTGNEFSSATPPAKGAWIVAEDVSGLQTASNRFSGNLPEKISVPKR